MPIRGRIKMAEIAKGYEDCLTGMSVGDLDRHEGAIYGVWKDFRLAFLNNAWFKFARDNDGEPEISSQWSIGALIMDAFPDVVRSYYENAYVDCIKRQTTWNHRYECSSDTTCRIFHQKVIPLRDQCGLLVVNSLIIEEPHSSKRKTVTRPRETDYINSNGIYRQCCHCRRFGYRARNRRWDWIPAWINTLPGKTSHVICPVCYDYYYRYNQDTKR